MFKVFLVGAGGFLGSVSRYLMGNWVVRLSENHWFPYGTLVVNGLGCLLIGLVSGLAETRGILTHEVRLFLMVGVLGGFTTFSSFGHETLGLMRTAQTAAAFLNILLQVSIGLGAAWIGFQLARAI